MWAGNMQMQGVDMRCSNRGTVNELEMNRGSVINGGLFRWE